MSTPIIIITFERLESLKNTIESYKQFNDPYHIVIHDNGSTYPPMVKYLRELKQQGIPVYHYPKIHRDTDLDIVNNTVQAHLKTLKDPNINYVVTDSDIYFKDINQDLLSYYNHILNEFKYTKRINVVSPMIDIYDIPNYYPLKSKVFNRQENRFWKHPNQFNIKYKDKSFKAIYEQVDTHFGLYRYNESFKRMQWGIRCHSPYHCKHYEWYINPSSIPKCEQWYYSHSANHITHWKIK
jgi:hypothetical protein